MPPKPCASLLEIAWPTVPDHRHNLVARIVWKRIKRQRHWLDKPQPCLFRAFPYRRQLPTERRTTQQPRGIMRLRHRSPTPLPCLVGHHLEVEEARMVIGRDRPKNLFLSDCQNLVSIAQPLNEPAVAQYASHSERQSHHYDGEQHGEHKLFSH